MFSAVFERSFDTDMVYVKAKLENEAKKYFDDLARANRALEARLSGREAQMQILNRREMMARMRRKKT